MILLKWPLGVSISKTKLFYKLPKPQNGLGQSPTVSELCPVIHEKEKKGCGNTGQEYSSYMYPEHCIHLLAVGNYTGPSAEG